jgi:dCTP deaminase
MTRDHVDKEERPQLFGVFAREEILDRLPLPVSNPIGLVITPLLDRDGAIDADSVDLRLGTHFLLPRSLPEAYFSPDQNTATSLHVKVHVPLGRYLVIPAHQTVLGATLEFIKLPYDASGEILTKSSVARTFIVVETAPWIHPEYRGCLTLEIANVSNTPVLLYPGRPIGQLILLHVARDYNPDAKIESTYFGPIHPEAPPFDNPEDDLAKIGVRRTAVIRKGTIVKGGRFEVTEPGPKFRRAGADQSDRGGQG